ncbi:MAG: SDR family NAD(P)-dependent oxidoreductase [Acidimicrobiales bacterium]
MDLGLEGRVAVVAASSKGLGRATADALAAEGARLVICGRGEEALASAAETLRSAGTEVLAVPADVTDPATPERLVAAAIEQYGRLDVVVPTPVVRRPERHSRSTTTPFCWRSRRTS